jgi:hypothetical protein
MSGNNNPFVGVTNGRNQPSTGTQVKINPEDLVTLTCENCQGQVFAEGLVIKTVSALLTNNGKEGMLPIPAFYCVKCHAPVDKYLPEELRKKSVIVK